MTRRVGWRRHKDAAIAIFAVERGQYVRDPQLSVALSKGHHGSGTAFSLVQAAEGRAVPTAFLLRTVRPRILLAPSFPRPHDTCARVLA